MNSRPTTTNLHPLFRTPAHFIHIGQTDNNPIKDLVKYVKILEDYNRNLKEAWNLFETCQDPEMSKAIAELYGITFDD